MHYAAARARAGYHELPALAPNDFRWTSLESLVSLEIRDVDLAPDLVVVFSGVNDLQPAGHVPFHADYSVGHADILPRVTGVAPVPVRLVSRSVLLEWLLGRLRPAGSPAPAEGFTPSYAWAGGPKRDLGGIAQPARAEES